MEPLILGYLALSKLKSKFNLDKELVKQIMCILESNQVSNNLINTLNENV